MGIQNMGGLASRILPGGIRNISGFRGLFALASKQADRKVAQGEIFDHLPQAIMPTIFRYLPAPDLAKYSCASREWRALGKEEREKRKERAQKVVNELPKAINEDDRVIEITLKEPTKEQQECFDVVRSLPPTERRQASKDIRDALNDDKKKQLDNFLQNVALIDETDLLCRAISCGADVNSTAINGNTALHNAATCGREGAVQALLEEENIDINRPNVDVKTALQMAVSNGHAGIVQALIKKGAEMNHPDDRGNTALHTAAHKGFTEIVKTLLEAGADINCVNNVGTTALHKAAYTGCAKTVKTLLKADAEVNRNNNVGSTALHMAACIGCTEVVKTLLKAGAEINRVNNRKYTASQLAAYKGHTGIVEILEKIERRKKLFSRVMQNMCMIYIPK